MNKLLETSNKIFLIKFVRNVWKKLPTSFNLALLRWYQHDSSNLSRFKYLMQIVTFFLQSKQEKKKLFSYIFFRYIFSFSFSFYQIFEKPNRSLMKLFNIIFMQEKVWCYVHTTPPGGQKKPMRKKRKGKIHIIVGLLFFIWWAFTN